MKKKYALTFYLVVFLISNNALIAQDMVVNAFDKAYHSGANTVEQTFSFPANVDAYDQVIMTIKLTCPVGGCDPWDRFANIKMVYEGEDYEIGRFITPYGNGWCEWQLDVSEYRTFLTGDVTLKSFIETWSNGWELTVDFEFYNGTPDYQYVSIENMWVDYFKRYGDTIAYSNDIDAYLASIDGNAEKVVVRVVNTGHGQGNTQNAAEFSQKTHEIWIDGQMEFTQFLWKSDCTANPCSPQGGTWQFARAGWCPGQEVAPDDYDITSIVSTGTDVEIDYVLDDYYNSCSPWYPDCIDGSTCTQCTYNGGSHTEPVYKMSVQLMQFSNQALGIDDVFQTIDPIAVSPQPSTGEFSIDLSVVKNQQTELNIYHPSGQFLFNKTVQAGQKQEIVDLSDFPSGIYFLHLNTQTQLFTQKLLLLK